MTVYYDYIIVGASAAGIAAASKIRSLDATGSVVCIDQQKSMPYNTCLLVDYLSQEKTEAELALKAEQFYEEKNIDLLFGEKVVTLNAQAKKIYLSDGTELQYKKVLLATGTTARSFFGNQGEGFFHFHHLSDAIAIQKYCADNSVKKVAIIGAGLSGIEAADAFVKQGYEVFIFEKQDLLLPEFLEEKTGAFLKNVLESHGVHVLTRRTIASIQKNEKYTIVTDQESFVVDMVIETTGSIQNLKLAIQAGITTSSSGVLVDEYLKTSVDDIYAAGDVIGIQPQGHKTSMRNGTWPEAIKQGMVAGHNMVKQENLQKYQPLVVSTSSRFFGSAFLSSGSRKYAETINRLEYVTKDGCYVFFTEQNILKQAILVGQLAAVGYIRQCLERKEVFRMEFFISELDSSL